MEFLKLFLQKTKVALVKSRSLPTLELLAVFIAFKALHFVVRGFFVAGITDSYIFLDAQVMLSRLLKDNIKIKKYIRRKQIQGHK